MQRLRINMIITLILLIIILHTAAKTMRGIFSLAAQASPVTINTAQLPRESASSEENSLFAQLFRQVKRTQKKSKKASADTTKTWFKLKDLPAEIVSQSKPKVLQVISEDPALEVKNPALSKQDCARLTNLLAKDRLGNAQLTQEIASSFGPSAQQEAILLLTTNENAGFKNASTCPSLKKCLRQQARLEKEKQEQLTALFKKYKGSFNYKTKSGSDSWKSFYRRVNNFNHAQN